MMVILDLHSRRVIGWAVSNRMKRYLAIRALKMAVVLRQLLSVCIITPTVEANTVRTTTRNFCITTVSKCR